MREPRVESDTLQAGASSAALDWRAPSPEFLRLIPHDFARRHLVMSTGERDGVEHLAIAEQSDPAAVFNVGVKLRRALRTVTADGTTIAQVIDRAYAGIPCSGRDSMNEKPVQGAEIERLLADADRDLLTTSGKGPVVQLVDALLLEAAARGASDLHIQPLADRALVRYRVDGVLHTARELSVRSAPAVVSRIKVMAGMDIAERRLAQDGRATVTLGRSGTASRAIDLRISTFPTSYGERAVIRLLEGSGKRLESLEALGMSSEVRRRFLDRADRSNGIVLVTGPTGSGKTTTLYATLRWLATHRAGAANVMTIEDPIEYDLSGEGMAISQGQVNGKRGITFASGLRHILRQDPDVIMVGEIRDAETARIAIQASLTGHLVFSTVHTNDAAATVTRLVDLGIEPYLVSASLSAIVAQRLVRRKHDACAGAGCAECHGSGLLGRLGVFELLVVDETMRRQIARGATASELRAAARAAGMRTLEEEGSRLIADGATTKVEIMRVIQGEEAV